MLFWVVFAPVCPARTARRTPKRQSVRRTAKQNRARALKLLDKYTQALDSTQSFIASYELVQESSYYVPARGPRFSGKMYGWGQHRADCQRIYSQDYLWGDINTALMNLSKDTPQYNIRVNDGKKTYWHARRVGDPSVKGRVGYNDARPRKAVFYLSADAPILGFFRIEERLDSVLRQANQIAVRPKTETIGGSECYVIDARTKYGKYSIWLDPEHGYHPAKVETKATEGDEHAHERIVPKGLVKLGYLKNVRFEKIDGIWVPMEADVGIHNTHEPDTFVKDDTHFKRTKIVLNPDHDKLGSFDNPLENPSQDPELVNGT